MATRITINISKKVPGPLDYSSIQASVSIEREVSHGEDVLAAAAALQIQAEAAVDQQLHQQRSSPVAPVPGPTRPPIPAQAGQSANNGQRAGGSPPPRPPAHGRRSPPRATPNQIALLQRLSGPEQVLAICEHHQIQQLADLTVAQASAVIDQLKAPR